MSGRIQSDLVPQRTFLAPDQDASSGAASLAAASITRDDTAASALQHGVPAEVRDFMNGNFSLSISPISNYKVSVVGQALGMPLVPGVNIEFPGTTLNETIHGEQTIIAVAHALGLQKLDTIYFDSGAPCGHCRQVLHELATDPVLWIDGRPPRPLSSYLPEAFGPADLGLEGGSLSAARQNLNLVWGANQPDASAALALEFASRSYAPYSKAFGGVVLTLDDGRLCPGAYIENAAFNPSLSPFHSAISNLVANFRGTFDQIRAVTLVSVPNDKVSHSAPIFRLLHAMKLAVPVTELIAVHQPAEAV